MATLPQHGEIIVNLNNNGQIASTVFFSDDSNANPTYYDPNQAVVVPDPGQSFSKGADWVTVVLWPNGSVKSYESQSANGDHVLLNFEQGSPGSSLVFGSDSSMSHGALISSDIVSSQNHTEVQQEFANGHLTHYLLTSTDSGHPLRIEGTYNASAAGGDDPHLVITLENNQFGAGNPLRAVSDTGNFDLLRLITNDGGSLITNDGGSLITNDGGSFHLISNDGASLITNDGGSLITNDGGSLQGLAIDQLIGKEAARIIGNDGASLIATGASGIISNDGASFGPSGFLSGGPGTQGEGAINLLANLQASLSHNFAHYEALTDDTADVGSQAGASTVVLGVQVTGAIASTGQAVWYKFHLDAGQSYVFDLKGQASASGTLFDPYLRLLDSNGNLITQVDDGGTGTDARLAFTAVASGDVYLVARAFNDAGTGSFAFSAAIAPVGPTIFSNGGGDTAVINVAENISTSDSTTIAVVQGFDLTDGATLHYSISGEDAADFDLNQFNGILAFHLPIDYENAHDANHDNIYHIVLTATDSDGHTNSQVVTVNVQDVVEPIYGSHGDDVIDASYHDSRGNAPGAAGEWIFALSGNDVVEGFGGNDSIQGGPGDDTIDGGDGNDSAVFVGDRALYTIARDQLTGTVVVSGHDGTDVLTNVERLMFDDQDVVLQIRGTIGNDVLEGTAGDDELNPVVGEKRDSVDGKGGIDRLVVDYSAAQADVTFVVYTTNVNNITVTFHSIRAGGQNAPLNEVFYSNVEAFTVRGSTSHSNVLHGDSRDDVLVGGSATDTLTGLGGDDIIDVGKGGATSGATGTDSVDLGLSGNDLLIADYSAATENVTFAWAAAASGNSTDGYRDYTTYGNATGATYNGVGRLSFAGVERFNISTGSGNDSITTGDGADSIAAGGGNDWLNSGRGHAVINGGTGTDLWQADLTWLTVGQTIDLTDPAVTRTLTDGSTIVNIERLSLTGSTANDVITLGVASAAFANTVNGGLGDDQVTMRGGATSGATGTNSVDLGLSGNDLLIADYSAATENVTFAWAAAASGNSTDGYRDYTTNGNATGATYNGVGRLSFAGVERFNISTGSGNDSITTGDGADSIAAGGGNDWLNSGRGHAVINGGTGTDLWQADLTWLTVGQTIDLTDPAVTRTLTDGSTIVNIERLSLTGSTANDVITLGVASAAFANTVNGGLGDDQVTMRGGATSGATGTNSVDLGLSGNDLLIADYSAATENVTFAWAAAASGNSTDGYRDYTTNGNATGATYNGVGRLSFAGVERFNISTGSGNDSITTGDGADSIAAGGGNDWLNSGRGHAVINGGTGTDLWQADLTWLTVGQTIDLTDPAVTRTLTDGSTIVNIERLSLTGSTANDVITLGVASAAFANTVNGGLGDDQVTMRGGATSGATGTNSVDLGLSGNDLLIADYSAATENVTFAWAAAASGNSTDGYRDYTTNGNATGATYNGVGRLSFAGVERFNISTGSGNDSITTGDGADSIAAGGGSDTVRAGGGSDTISFNGVWKDYDISISGNEVVLHDRRVGAPTGTDHIFDAELFKFTSGVLSLSQLANHAPTNVSLSGSTVGENASNGTVIGTLTASDPDSALGDTATYTLLDSAGGRFALSGSTIVVANGALLNYESATSHDISVKVTDLGGLSYTKTVAVSITNVAEPIGSIGDLDGGAGGAIAENAAAGSAVGITASATDPDAIDHPIHYSLDNNGLGHFVIDSVTGIVTTSTTKIDREVDGSTLTIVVRATSPDSSFSTNSFAITVNNVAGANIIGTSGADVIDGTHSTPGQPLPTNEEDSILGKAGNDKIAALGGNNSVDGGTGDDTITGGAGNDTIIGGANVDTADFSDKSAKVTVALVGGAGTATIGSTEHDTLSGIENLTGGSTGDALAGDTGANVLIGNGGNDTLGGGDGNDTLKGGAGDDALNGGANVDTADFSDKTTKVTVSLIGGGGTATIAGSTEHDTLTGVENLVGGSMGDALTGDTGTNLLIGNGGNDTLVGGNGTDTLSGGIGADRLDGGFGLDTASYATSATGVKVNLATGVLSGGDAQGDVLVSIENVIGSNAANVLIGSSVANSLIGGDGNDSLNGGLGNDMLSGGNGKDSFVFNTALNAATNRDVITEFVALDDTIQLENLIFTKLAGPNNTTLSAAQFFAGTAAHDLDDRIIYNKATGALLYDADGNKVGGVAAIQFATLGTSVHPATVTNADFFII